MVHEDEVRQLSDHPEDAGPRGLTRRTAIKASAGIAAGLASLQAIGRQAFIPQRAAADDTTVTPNATLPDIQFDVGAFIHPVTTVNGLQVQFPPVNTTFLTARLLRTPDNSDQSEMNRALNTIEAVYPFSASGIITHVSYGQGFFNRLPASVRSAIPRLASNTSRSVLETAVPAPTDVSSANPGISKLRFNVPVQIENNDVCFMVRSDNSARVNDVINWLLGSNVLGGFFIFSPAFGSLLSFTTIRNMFIQTGLPRSVANQNRLPFAKFVNPQSPMWMGFADQQTNGAGPAAICTFQGNASARLTTAKAGDYFDNGSIQHLSHDIIDFLQWMDMADANSAPDDDGIFTERVQYMFHAPEINPGNADQFTDGGGPAFLPNTFNGVNYARETSLGQHNVDVRRMGHLSTLQRSSRAADGTPMHIRTDGPGFSAGDVPDGSSQPKLQFSVFVPTSEFFRQMRVNQASLDLQNANGVDEEDNGLERFLTATRRQNFLVPPRRHRAWPLVEFT